MSEVNAAGIELQFEDLAELFVKMGSTLSPTYLHGSITGVLSAGKRMTQDDWLDWALDQMAPTEEVQESHITILQGLYFKTLSELQDEGLAFRLILPDEETPMADRLDALSEWTGSFLGAFGATGVVQETSDMPATLQEILEDLAEIAQVDALSAEEQDADEDDYLAVAEHVRVSALTVFLEYNEPPATTDGETTVH
ncbi:UPF0149 family protein [Reinekea sp. G2M2-21]|uniref:UPF0149 family protein n=1 Tax=Reinekea sp. G2M2-21 TaxID=2788942 RepID=UPI0018ABA990|nr:UPF0149 family protein [Reinekea sp. G2M2-21]